MSNNVTLTPLLCFIVCDGGPASHFAAFATYLILQNAYRINMYANGPALAKLKDSNIPNDINLFSFTIDDFNNEENEKVASQLINNCIEQGARTIIVDIGNKFDPLLQKAVAKQNVSNSMIRSWCYYDNPEPYVPGGYSTKTEDTIKASQYVLFANKNLAQTNSTVYSLPEKKIDLTNKTIHGIGYYPVTDAEKLLQQRQIDREPLRAQNNWTNVKHLFVYFGGNNDAYFDQAFPSFLSSLSQVDKNLIKDVIFLVHQHPAAKKQNRDGLLLNEWLKENNHLQISLSKLNSSDQALIVADAALYYQTSLAPYFALVGLPIMQIGHEIYRDVLVSHNLCYTATNANELNCGLTAIKETNTSLNSIEQRKQLIYNAIGYTSEWPNNLRRILI